MCCAEKLHSVQKSNISMIDAQVSQRIRASQQQAAGPKLEERLLICMLPSQSRSIRSGTVPPKSKNHPADCQAAVQSQELCFKTNEKVNKDGSSV